jgi:hypothetical protein
MPAGCGQQELRRGFRAGRAVAGGELPGSWLRGRAVTRPRLVWPVPGGFAGCAAAAALSSLRGYARGAAGGGLCVPRSEAGGVGGGAGGGRRAGGAGACSGAAGASGGAPSAALAPASGQGVGTGGGCGIAAGFWEVVGAGAGGVRVWAGLAGEAAAVAVVGLGGILQRIERTVPPGSAPVGLIAEALQSLASAPREDGVVNLCSPPGMDFGDCARRASTWRRAYGSGSLCSVTE